MTAAHTPPAPGLAAPRHHTAGPVWARWGGAGILTGGALLLAATLVEAGLDGTASPSGPLALFTALFLASTVAHAAAMVPLALGGTGSDGAVGSRSLGRVALLVFGATFLLSQTLYYVLTYTVPGEVASGAGVLLLVVGVVQVAALVTGAVSIARAGVARGAARWALLALTAVAVLTGAVVNAVDDTGVVTGALLVSTVSQVAVGLVYLTSRGTPRR